MGQGIDLSGFDKSSKEDWIDTVKRELNLENPMENFRWHCDPSIMVDPIYFSEDVDFLKEVNSPLRENPEWINFAKIEISKPDKALVFCRTILPYCDAFILDFSKISKIHEIDIFEQILSIKPVVHLTGLCHQTIVDLLSIVKGKDISGSLGYNPLGTNDNVEVAFSTGLLNQSDLDGFSLFKIYGEEQINSGASIVQEVGTVLSILVEYINQLTEEGINSETAFNKIEISTGIGQNFFHEVAKIRAYRGLLNAIAKEFSIDQHYIKINATTNVHNTTNSESDTNLIRNTIAAMAMVIGGADTIHVRPQFNDKPSVNDHHISLNISNLLKEESHFSKVLNPEAGSFYIERLTEMISQAAWAFFQEIESLGGFVNARNSGWLEKQFASHEKWLKSK